MMTLDEVKDRVLVYDIETESNDDNPENAKFPAYCKLAMVSYQLGLDNEPELVDLASRESRSRFRELLRDPSLLKVSYNGINFDDIVLMRHGFYVEPTGRHDMFLALKTVAPRLASHSLKYVSFIYFGDDHEPQWRLNAWKLNNKKKSLYQAPEDILGVYCIHDVRQTAKIFKFIWEVVQRPLHWQVYTEMELAMAEPLHEMVLTAGEWIHPLDTLRKIRTLKREARRIRKKIIRLSHGGISKPNSPLQVSKYFKKHGIINKDIDDYEDNVPLPVRKSSLVVSDHPLAQAVYKLRDTCKVIQHWYGHFKAAKAEYKKPSGLSFYAQPPMSNGQLKPLDYRASFAKASHKFAYGSDGLEAIPKGYSMSTAKTRRFQSSSQFGINFQNQNKRTKIVQVVPYGWLGCWIDSRQIENIVHIWASEDRVRRVAYEADVDWNEYVWLTNEILRSKLSRKELESMKSSLNPNISVYKQYKTTKLALNFFMGPTSFAKSIGVTVEQAKRLFDQVHRACPAIRRIGEMLRQKILDQGYIRDPFGHIYAGSPANTQMLTVNLVQGCGTGSVPKAMTIANYKTLHSLDSDTALYWPCVYDRFKKRYSYGTICGTTHDECAFRISLGLPAREIVRLVRGCLYNMEEKFSPLFDGIPLRAQLAVSITNAGEQEELDHRAPDFVKVLLEKIRVGRKEMYKMT